LYVARQVRPRASAEEADVAEPRAVASGCYDHFVLKANTRIQEGDVERSIRSLPFAVLQASFSTVRWQSKKARRNLLTFPV